MHDEGDTVQPGSEQRLAEAVWRLTAPNGGPLTGTGTNTYLLGAARSVVIDPGPALPEHTRALVAALNDAPASGENPRHVHVLVTHTHLDHSPGATLLRDELAARNVTVTLIGLAPPPHERQDQSFVPQLQPADNELLVLDDVRLRAIHTPGHASNHVCYLHPASGLLFTGDHVMQGSTVVIPPPDGNMAHYIASLHKIAALAPGAIAPGHGTLITDPQRAVRRLIRHRLQREARVRDRLRQLGEASLAELLPHVYADVDERLWPVAQYSLHAHLLKLEADGEARCSDSKWSLAAG